MNTSPPTKRRTTQSTKNSSNDIFQFHIASHPNSRQTESNNVVKMGATFWHLPHAHERQKSRANGGGKTLFPPAGADATPSPPLSSPPPSPLWCLSPPILSSSASTASSVMVEGQVLRRPTPKRRARDDHGLSSSSEAGSMRWRLLPPPTRWIWGGDRFGARRRHLFLLLLTDELEPTAACRGLHPAELPVPELPPSPAIARCGLPASELLPPRPPWPLLLPPRGCIRG
jgi:hypothetical protein